MVFTPNARPTEPGGQLSPLILPVDRTSSASSIHSASPPWTASYPPPLRKNSGSSFSKLSDFRLDSEAEDEEPDNGVDGVRHVGLSVDAHEWRHPVFKTKVLSILRQLKVPVWTSPLLTPSSIHLQRVSGALTNAVFFVSFNPRPTPTSPTMSPLLTPTLPATDPDHPTPFLPKEYPPTLLLRIYGPSSDALISREEELRILHVLCTQYGLGPRIYGTFENGRVEQFFPSRALHAEELRDPEVSKAIGRRMRELHSVDLKALGYDKGKAAEAVVWKCFREWVGLAEKVMDPLREVGGKWEVYVERFGLHRLTAEIEKFRQTIGEADAVVFAHNDTQYGNLLKLDTPPRNRPPHHSYIVIDFEYAAPNARGYDIANHFHEWRANYHHPTHSHSMVHFPYPDLAQRETFYRAYLSIEMDGASGEEIVKRSQEVSQDKVDKLEHEVRSWSPACSVFWALWGIIQAGEQADNIVSGQGEEVEFDYLSYALEKLELFRKEAREFGVPI